MGRNRHLRPQLRTATISAQAGSLDRDRIFSALRARNRVVDVLRIAVPAFGAVVLGGLVLGLFVGNLAGEFGFADVRIDRNNLVVGAPSYSSMGADGSTYHVVAATARSAMDNPDSIDLRDAVLTIGRPTGVVITARAEAARFSTGTQVVHVAGTTEIADSEGMAGTVDGLVGDFVDEQVQADGAVDMRFASGATLTAKNMRYDGERGVWRFEDATVELTATPGEADVEGGMP